MEAAQLMKRLLLLSLLPLSALADVYTPGSANDPKLRAVQYLSEDGRHYSALSQLRALDVNDDYTKMPEAYQWQLAQDSLNFGLREKAEAIYRHLARKASDRERLARARVQVAEFDYQRGYWEAAEAALISLRERLPREVVEDWQDLYARVLLAQGRYNEASAILTEMDNGDRQSPYTRYNLAVAYLNDGQTARGRDVLDRVGRLRVVDVETLALRDRANLTLGWHYLKSQMGGPAKIIFERVRVEGPFSNRALLGLGWAEIAPRGDRQTRQLPEDISPFSTFSTLGGLLQPGFLETDLYKRAGIRELTLSREEEAAFLRALTAWVELIERDPVDPAVQEAWLAIAFTLDRLGAHTQALDYYERTVRMLEQNQQRMNAAMESIRQGRMINTIVRRDADNESGWLWKLRDLPDAPETYYLQHLLAEHRFQEALKNYRDVRLMARSLDGWQSRLDAMEREFLASQRPQEEPQALFARAKAEWQDPLAKLKIPNLRTETTLSPPGLHETADPALEEPVPPTPLQLARSPGRFVGQLEKIRELRARTAILREQVAVNGGAQTELIQNMAIAELDAQKKTIEKYLVEARFALARLYDRQRKGELK